MPNITMTLDERLLRMARKVALEKGASLTELIRRYLLSLVVGENDRKQKAISRLEKLWKNSKVVVSPVRWTRDDIHDR